MSGEQNSSILNEFIKLLLQGRLDGSDKPEDVALAQNRALKIWSLLVGNDGERERVVALTSSRELKVVLGGVAKCLGSSAPAATTETVLYTVPTSKQAYVHSLWVCNRSTIESMRIGISVGGGALATDDYVLYDVTVPAADALFWSSPRMWCLSAADEVRIRSSAGNLTYKIFGEEI